eukprot:tig00021168_g19092.t1
MAPRDLEEGARAGSAAQDPAYAQAASGAGPGPAAAVKLTFDSDHEAGAKDGCRPAPAAGGGRRGSLQEEEGSVFKHTQKVITREFSNIKLNVRRAEVFLRTYRRQLLYQVLPPFACLSALFFGLVITILPVDQAHEHAAQYVGAGGLLNVVQLGSDREAFLASNTREDFLRFARRTAALLLDTSGSNPTADYLRPVGLLRLRQVRVERVPAEECSSRPPALLAALFGAEGACFPPYHERHGSSNADRRPFRGPASGAEYTFEESGSPLLSSWAYFRDTAYYPDYGSGHHTLVLSRDPAAALRQIDDAEQDKWIDDSTRAVAMDATLYNRHSRLFVVLELLAELPNSGAMIPSYRVRTLKLETLENPTTYGFCILFCIVVTMYGLNSISKIGRDGVLHMSFFRKFFAADASFDDFFRSLWDLLEMFAVVLYFVMIGYVAAYVRTCRGIQKELEVDARGRYIDFQEARRLFEVASELAGINVLMTAIWTFLFLSLERRIAVIWRTLFFARWDLLAFVACFFVMFAGYAFMGNIIFGYQLPRFHNFTASFASLFRFLGGDFEYDDINSASPVAGMVYFFSFMILVVWIAFNMFIAILNKYYADACDEADSHEEEERSLQAGSENLAMIGRLLRYRVFAVLRAPGTAEAEPPPLGSSDNDRPNANASSRRLIKPGKKGEIQLKFDLPGPWKEVGSQAGFGGRSALALPRQQTVIKAAVEGEAHGEEEFKRFVFKMLTQGDVVYLEYVDDPVAEGSASLRARAWHGLKRFVGFASAYLETRVLGKPKENEARGEESGRDEPANVLLHPLMRLRIPPSIAYPRVLFQLVLPSFFRFGRSASLLREMGAGRFNPVSGFAKRGQTLPVDGQRADGEPQAGDPPTRFSWFTRAFRLDLPDPILDDDEIEKIVSRLAKKSRDRQSDKQEFLEAFRLETTLQQLSKYDKDSGQVARALELAVDLDLLLRAMRSSELQEPMRRAESGPAPAEGAGAREGPAPAELDREAAAPAGAAAASVRSQGRVTWGARAESRPLHAPRTAEGRKALQDGYSEILEVADKLQQCLQDLSFVQTRQPSTLSSESIRFDELVAVISWHLSVSGRQGQHSLAHIKHEAVRIVASFPQECFDPLDEKTAISEYSPVASWGGISIDKIQNSDRDPAFSFEDIIELLGEVIHDRWSLGCLQRGYRYGWPRNDDESKGPKQHPLLVPYKELEEKDKLYDKNIVIYLLRIIVALGYKITRTSTSSCNDEDKASRSLQPHPENARFKDLLPGGYTLMWVPGAEHRTLNPSLYELRELLAESVHDSWALSKMREGVVWGEKTVDKKTHELLKPYGLMSAREKKSDRASVDATLKTLLAVRPSPPPHPIPIPPSPPSSSSQPPPFPLSSPNPATPLQPRTPI